MADALRPLLLLLVTIAAFHSGPASAKTVTADVEQVAALLKQSGRTAEIKSAEQARYVRVSDGYGYSIFPFGCDDKGRNCKSVQFYTAFNPKAPPSLQVMNDYARDNRWGRVYLDKDEDPAIEFDLDLEQGGMSEALFLDNVAYWDAVVDKFGEFVFGPNGENNPAAK